METIKLSTRGRLTIPKHIRTSLNWETGQRLEIAIVKSGVILKTVKPFRPTRLDDVAGFLAYKGETKTINAMHENVGEGLSESYQ